MYYFEKKSLMANKLPDHIGFKWYTKNILKNSISFLDDIWNANPIPYYLLPLRYSDLVGPS